MLLGLYTSRTFEVTDVLAGSDAAMPAGRHLLELFDQHSSADATRFLAQLSDLGIALSIPLRATTGGSSQLLRFSGCARGDSILIVAAERDRVALDALMSSDDVKARLLRYLLSTLTMADPEETHRLYGELTRLNNDMSTLHRELGMQKRELARLNVEKNRFIGFAAHDLRSPIGNIGVYAEMIADTAGLDPEVRSFAGEIVGLARDMGNLVNEILDVSAIESGTFTLNLGTVDLREATARAIALHRHLAERKQVELRFNEEGVSAAVEADAGKLGQVLSNLVSNAVKFSYPGSPVDIEVSEEDGGALLSVRDYGVGIRADEQSRLFVPFEKLSARSTAGESSTGLGLAIVRKVVEAHGGRIAVESTPGSGSTFTVWLPGLASS